MSQARSIFSTDLPLADIRVTDIPDEPCELCHAAGERTDRGPGADRAHHCAAQRISCDLPDIPWAGCGHSHAPGRQRALLRGGVRQHDWSRRHRRRSGNNAGEDADRIRRRGRDWPNLDPTRRQQISTLRDDAVRSDRRSASLLRSRLRPADAARLHGGPADGQISAPGGASHGHWAFGRSRSAAATPRGHDCSHRIPGQRGKDNRAGTADRLPYRGLGRPCVRSLDFAQSTAAL